MPLQRPALRRQAVSFLPAAILALKLIAAVLASASVTMLLWPDEWKVAAPPQPDIYDPELYAGRESKVYRKERLVPAMEKAAEERGIPLNFPRRVQTVRFTPPSQHAGLPPVTLPPGTNPLAGKQLRYLIGTSASVVGRDDEVTEVAYGAPPAKRGVSIAYCNLFDEHNTGKYGPYLRTSDTAAQYGEGQIDPRGPGWEKNLREQFERRKRQGFQYIELDNPDAYSIKDVIGAVDLAESYGLKVIAKNPGLMGGGATAYVQHRNVYGIIVEKGAGGARDMDALRRRAGKADLPVWFVAFGSGRSWAGNVANGAKQYRNMGVTYSSAGEYGNAIDILPPV